jgi:hypothetical protein
MKPTPSFNTILFEYLGHLAYEGSINDRLRSFLKDETGSTLRQINDLARLYMTQLEADGSQINSMVYNYLGQLGFKGSLNDRIVRSLTDSAPPIECVLSMDAAFVGLFGIAPADIDGRKVYLEGNTEARHGVSTDITVPTPAWGDQDRVFEINNILINPLDPNTGVSAVFLPGDLSFSVVLNISVGLMQVELYTETPPAGDADNFFSVPIVSIPNSVAISVNAETGKVRMFIDGEEIVSLPSVYDSVFENTDAYSVAVIFTSQEESGVDFETTYSVSQGTYQGVYPANQMYDWCGNEL